MAFRLRVAPVGIRASASLLSEGLSCMLSVHLQAVNPLGSAISRFIREPPIPLVVRRSSMPTHVPARDPRDATTTSVGLMKTIVDGKLE